MKIGVFPIVDHYYEPQFDFRKLKQPLSQDRNLPGIDWNISGQLKILASFSHSSELERLLQEESSTRRYRPDSVLFGPGDAEYWYQLIRLIKPGKVFEVGSGNSTLIAIEAIRKNREADPNYSCKHICIEPYEGPWLEGTGVLVIRKKIEDFDIKFFSELGENDILFIDTSHVTRPQGDVLYEYLELLPTMNKGIIVHVHDIFSPKNYPKLLLEERVRFFNEQYLLEAFLSHNSSWKIIGALNYLHHHYYENLKSVAPFLTPDKEPCSLYMRKVV